MTNSQVVLVFEDSLPVYVSEVPETSIHILDGCGLAGASAEARGYVFFTSLQVPAEKVLVQSWRYPNRHLASAITDASVVTVQAFCISGQNYAPEATLNGFPMEIEETSTIRTFVATSVVPLSLGENPLTITLSSGASDTINITRVPGGPVISSAFVQPPSFPKTHFYQNQQALLTITNPPDAVEYELFASGACATSKTFPASSDAQTTTTFTVSSASSGTVSVRAKNSFGSWGPVFQTSAVPLDQTLPSVSGDVSYPSSQLAVKNNQSILLSLTYANQTSGSIDLPLGFSGTASLEPTKALLVSSSPVTEGFASVVATVVRETNGTQMQATVPVYVCNVPPTVTVTLSGNPSKLRKSPGGTPYVVVLTFSQPLLSLSTNLSEVSFSPSVDRKQWTGTVRIYDNTPNGDFTISGTCVGAAGHEASFSKTFTVGGFLPRTITWPAFSRVAPLGTQISTYQNLLCSLGAKTLVLKNSNENSPDGFYPADADGSFNPTGSYIGLSDIAFSQANTTGTLTGVVEEL